MPDYIVNGLIYKGGKKHRFGDTITLTEEQAEALGTQVIKKDIATADLSDKGVKELRKLASEAGIEGYSSLNKADLITELEAIQNSVPVESEAEAVSDDEPTSG